MNPVLLNGRGLEHSKKSIAHLSSFIVSYHHCLCFMLQGFLRVYEDMPDICLDVPLAYTVLERFVERCQKGGFVTDEVIKKMPSRFVYETDRT